MNAFDAIVFDCDGVLVDSEVLAMEISQKIVWDLGWKADLDTMFDLFVGCSSDYFAKTVEEHIGRPLDPGYSLPYRGMLEQAFRERLQPVPGIVDVLDGITVPMAVASNSRHDRIRLGLEVTGLLHRFDGRISSAEDVAQGKPAPDVYLHAADLLGVDPARCIAVDDSKFGVEAAYRAGMHVFAYYAHPNVSSTVASPRVTVFRDMSELPALIDAAQGSQTNAP